MNNILNCGLNKESIVTLLSLCEMDVNPQALANVVTQINSEYEAHLAKVNNTNNSNNNQNQKK
eukprot:CAMPEP_0116922322 /NCGR_PEP_ID=MMETSP0467-20121206/22192_1 /TAXON_ID=283647 /ORGANISM="Mesodinium pulex, Strain SPMC105" /LENGTH=62 /DNA_ID=CAMNT_0004600629 /DNA_START=61 /DNA_END=249 /DNA_ORIENTATION=-